MHERLSVKISLFKQNITNNLYFISCSQHEETHDHLFIFCPYTHNLWLNIISFTNCDIQSLLFSNVNFSLEENLSTQLTVLISIPWNTIFDAI